jgi:predicted DNA-binding transcriptional regulator AlpA
MSTLRTEPNTATAVEPLAVGAQQLGKLLGLSKRTIYRRDSSGQLPRAVRIGRAKRWLVDEIREWLKAGTPSREDWERSKERSDAA